MGQFLSSVPRFLTSTDKDALQIVNPERDFISELPDELIVYILKHADCPVGHISTSLHPLRLVCARWNFIIVDIMRISRKAQILLECCKRKIEWQFTKNGACNFNPKLWSICLEIYTGWCQKSITSKHLAEVMQLAPKILRCRVLVISCATIKAKPKELREMFKIFSRFEDLSHFRLEIDRINKELFLLLKDFLVKQNPISVKVDVRSATKWSLALQKVGIELIKEHEHSGKTLLMQRTTTTQIEYKF